MIPPRTATMPEIKQISNKTHSYATAATIKSKSKSKSKFLYI